MKLISPAFEHEGSIPSKYTYDGEDINPELNIKEILENTKTLALIMDDPDAPIGTWDHWILWNIPIISKIEENSIPEGAIQGLNSFKKNDYGGPCPPDKEHRYFFKLFALDTSLDLKEDSTKEELLKTMENHILEKTELMGKYNRQ